MEMTCEEAQDLITGLVDHQLAAAEQAAVQAHLRECSNCKSVAEQERAIKEALHRRAERMRAPAELRNSILADERIFPKQRRSRRWWEYFWPMTHIGRAAFVGALLLAVALPALLLRRPSTESVAAAALASYDDLARSDLSTVRAEKPEEIVARLVRDVGGHFHPMGYDLSARRLRPATGFIREIHGRKILIVVYRGEGGLLFCYTFVGSEADAPSNAATFFDTTKKLNLYAFSRGRVNAVLHREGELICILASEMPTDELLELARSKARTS